MNRASPIVRDLDRAAAIVLAVGLVIFALANGVSAPWRFFAPIFDSFTGHGSAFGAAGLATTVADLCFVVAVALFAAARAAGIWFHYSRMPILNWATAEARRRRAGGHPAGPNEPVPEEFESEEEYYERVHPQPQEKAAAGTSEAPQEGGEAAPAGPTWRAHLISLWELLTEQRAQPSVPVPPVPPTRLLNRGSETAGPVDSIPRADQTPAVTPVPPPPLQPASADPWLSPAPAAMPPAPVATPTPIADDFGPDDLTPILEGSPAPAAAPTASEDHDFASDPDFRAGAPAGLADDDDLWPPEEIT